MYILNVTDFLSKELPTKFSFEKDYLEKYVIENGLSQNKQLPRNLIKNAIKKQTKYAGYEWKYKK